MAAFMLPGGMELWIILAVVLVIFGPTQLPKLAKMFGKSAKSLKEGLDGAISDETDAAKSDAPEPDATPAEPTEAPKPEAPKDES